MISIDAFAFVCTGQILIVARWTQFANNAVQSFSRRTRKALQYGSQPHGIGNRSMTHQLEHVEPPLYARSVQTTVVVVLLIALTYAARRIPVPNRRDGSQFSQPLAIDLNRAAPRELSLLPGVGPVLAKRIFENRQRLGPFESAHDVGRVHGIGDKTIEQIAPYATVNPDNPTEPPRLASKSTKVAGTIGADR